VIIDNPNRFLLVEDNSGDARLIKEYLSETQKAPFEIQVTERLSDGLNVLRDKRFDLVLLDLNLPDSSGIETLIKVKAEARKTAIIVLTGLNDEEVAVKALQKGAQDYLVKDQINPNLLSRAIRYAIERMLNELTLREREARYRSLFENMLNGFAYCQMLYKNCKSDDFIYLDVNKAFEKITGLRNVVGKRVTEVIPGIKETMPELLDIYARVAETGIPEQFEIYFRPLDIWLNISGYSLQKGYFVSVFDNITERKQSEEALLESEKKYRNLFENLYDVYYRTDAKGLITLLSPSIERYFGYTPDELIGQNIKDVYVNPQRREEFLSLLLKDGYVDNFEAQLKRKDNSVIWVSTNAKIIKDEKSDFRSVEGITRDVSEHKRMEDEKAKIQAQLQQSLKMESIGTLAGGIAHDFNNILSSVIGFTELSLDEVEKGTHLEDNLQEIYTAGKRAKDLVRQILAFARQSEEELKPIQVYTIATEVLKFIRSSIPATIKIKQNIESDSLIMGSGTQVHQILMNLFTNAAHAMEDKGGILEFSLKDVVMDRGVTREKLGLKPGNYIEIKVSDTGIGIAPEIIGSIFDPYFTTKNPGEGTGMGLATVHGIIESYGGKISVDSKLGQGTRFTIYLPMTGKRQEHHPYQPETLPTGKERILFVDDEAPIAKMGGQALERLGYTVSIRTSSIEALALFRTKPNDFDLVITDMTMPNMTGDSLAIELMKIRPDIPVVLCTGYSKNISEESASEMGIKAFIYKPVVKADLAKTVRKVLDEAKGSAQ